MIILGKYKEGCDFLMLKEKYENWTKEFMESWKNLERRRTLDLLSKDVKYYENPIDKPCNNFDEVVKLWEVVVDNQKDIDYKFSILSYSEDVCIINWQMTRTMINNNQKQEIDGVFQISLDEQGLCSYFKQWRFTRYKGGFNNEIKR